ncbi:MAG: bifunctional diaminohydroxyphosphoribosylaminopyrimidine deaminase/5-amino-6-(5-phosphoribosylamino)uracil reductase RibD [Cyclobacteriaceae bacterium]|nr:bifunctional diaminohydroxyphosphoribosylaminopyrimidine deaminase/5-amino-6-(5-phosphoribosylamino)uracil reductase RibD [Cyclobacteriaceae bacterium]
MISDKFYMLRAMELAKNGIGQVSPNPLVGCVVVHEDKIIGEGWHRKYGEAHAEVNAINAVADKSLLKDSVVYVNLEPCAHTGKTPPCADLLIKHQVSRVVIANVDPNPLVAGKGISKLKEAGIEVITKVLEDEGHELNKRFFAFLKYKRPFIILKWAKTSDGFIARENFDSKWISNEYSRKLVHKWRTEEDSILVGYNTAVHDNPKLTARDWTGRNPVRIVIDPKLNLDSSLNLFDGATPTICYNTLKQEVKGNLEYHLLKKERLLQDMLTDLFNRSIQSLFVEGGAQTIKTFLTSNVWDEARVFTSEQSFEHGIEAQIIKKEPWSSEMIGNDELNIYSNNTKI